MNSATTASIGTRLKEERLRLGFNQVDFAAIAKTTKRSQYEYETDGASPGAAYLAAIATAGADVQYIVTGRRASDCLATDERQLVERYRQAPIVLREATLRLLNVTESRESFPL